MADTILRCEDCAMTGFLKSVAPIVIDNAKMNKLIRCSSYLCRVPPVVELAENLAHMTPGKLKKSFFGNGGAVAEVIRGTFLKSGLLVGGDVSANVVRFQPPLVITRQQIDQSIGICTEALRSVAQPAHASA
jgi:4-aminobutyrate aminotransferase-like enzyme